MAAPYIGVIGAKQVAGLLARFGFRVVTDDDPYQAASAIAEAMREHGPFRVVIGDTASTAQLAGWVSESASAIRLAVVPHPSGAGMLAGTPQRLADGATLNDLFAALGYQTTGRPEGSTVVTADDPPAAPAPEPQPEAAPLPEPEPETPGEPEPKTSPAAPEPQFPDEAVPTGPVAPGPVEEAFPDELFITNDQPAPAPEPVPVVPQTPAPVPQVQPHVAAPEQVAPVQPAPVAPTPAAQSQPVAGGVPSREDEDFFARRAGARGTATAPARTGRGQVIVVAAGKGGVGKSTTSILLADIAARAGLRAVLVDANRGQADVRKLLRLGGAELPTVYDVAAGAEPDAVILAPGTYGPFRQAARLDVPDFAIVLGPPADLADPRWASPEVYARIVDRAREVADLVVIDTQIVEAHLTDLWEGFLLPLLRGGAWLVGITDESSPGVSNLLDRLGELIGHGVSPATTLVLATRYENFTAEDAAYFQARFDRLGAFIGATGNDEQFRDQMNLGRIVHDSPAVAPAMRAVLRRVTGRDLFAGQGKPGGKRRLFGRG